MKKGNGLNGARRRRDICTHLLRLLMCVVFLFVAESDVFATKSTVIKVGCYPLHNYHEMDESGQVTGYEAEYLHQISDNSRYVFEYVQADSWDDAVKMLKNHEIDLLSPALIEEKYMEDYAFGSETLGKTYRVIVTRQEETSYEDFAHFSKMTFGLEEGETHEEEWNAYVNKHGFDPAVRIYPDHEALLRALDNGEVDAIVDDIMQIQDGMSVIGRLRSSSYYFMARKEDTALLDDISETLYRVTENDPGFREELLKIYFPDYDQQILTKEEEDFVASLGELVVGCTVNIDPVCYLDENGEIAGITRDILDRVAERCGLTFRYKTLPNGEITYDDIRAAGIDLIGGVEYNSVNAALHDLQLTDPYVQAEKVMVGISGKYFDPQSYQTIAVCSGSQTLEQVIQRKYPNCVIEVYNDVEEILDAVLEGRADLALQNQYSIDKWLHKPKYSDLSVIATAGIGDSQSLSPVIYKEGDDKLDETLSNPLLHAVLNKGIRSLDSREVDLIVIKQTIQRQYQYTVEDVVYRYRYVAAILMILVGGITLLLICIIQMRKRNQKLEEQTRRYQKEEELRRLAEKAEKDSLTGLYNKDAFRRLGGQYLQQCESEQAALIFLDMDNFKAVNDTLGHMMGDQVLIESAEIIRELCGEKCIIARFGGDEFCILMKEISEEELDAHLALLEERLRMSYGSGQETVDISASIGVATSIECGYDLDKMMQHSDAALYIVKKNGKKGYLVWK